MQIQKQQIKLENEQKIAELTEKLQFTLTVFRSFINKKVSIQEEISKKKCKGININTDEIELEELETKIDYMNDRWIEIEINLLIQKKIKKYFIEDFKETIDKEAIPGKVIYAQQKMFS